LPDQIALKDMDASWVNSDITPDSGISENILFIRTHLLDELKINSLEFLSKDFFLNHNFTFQSLEFISI